MTADRNIFVSCALIASGFLLLYGKVLAALVGAWWTDGNYSHGFLIVPIAAYLAWERRHRLAAAPRQPSAWGLLIVVGSIVVLAAGILAAELFLTRLSIIGTVVGTVAFLVGWPRVRILAFPLAFLLLMIPLPAIIFNQIALPLQLLASRFGEVVLGAFDIPVLRDGNVLILAHTSLEVAEACSGIRSLISLLTLGIVFGYLADPRPWVRIVIALSTIPMAIIANGARVAGTGIAADRFGPAVAEGFFHQFAGWAVFVVAFLMMVVLHQFITLLGPSPRSKRLGSADHQHAA